LVLGAAAAGVEVWALIDAAFRPAAAFRAAGKASKPVWLAMTGVAAAVGVLGILPGGPSGFGGIASVAAIVIALVYLLDVRPAVRGTRPPRGHPGGQGHGW
jgi:hypothetical protein